MSAEKAAKYAKKPAVTCCRFEAGTLVSPDLLEDPAIFDDLVDSGLLNLDDGTLSIESVLGSTLTKTVDALTPLTSDVLDGVSAPAPEVKEEEVVAEEVVSEAPVVTSAPAYNGGVLKLHIGKGENIDIELPLMAPAANQGSAPMAAPVAVAGSETVTKEEVAEVRELRKLEKRYYKIDKVEFADETKVDGTTIYIRKDIAENAVAKEDLVVSVDLDIITENEYDKYSETIMDVQPIAVKEDGDLGSGITRIADGVVMMLTGVDENRVQIGEFGSSEGELSKNIMWGRPGAPDKGDIIIKGEVVIKAGTNMERPGPLAAHKAMDVITQEIREALKACENLTLARSEEFSQVRHSAKPKVVVIKEIMGQGAMHDNLILPVEPAGTLGGVPNVDLGNLPIVLSPLELLDGGIHALTCIGPASKETTRHYFREPLVMEALNDDTIDFAGVILVGSPQANTEKFYVSRRLGMTVEAMDVAGAIITTEGFGNNHIDFASHHEEIGKRGVKVVGCTYSAVQGALVVGNEYMVAMVDNNKSKQGIENEILSNNTLCKEDAIRALAMLKTQIAGGEIEEAERKWNTNVKLNNVKVIEEATNQKIELLDNEQVLPKSKKRLEIYEKED
jgi:D-proline reductase (dithiol) PrdA